jgi:hypothetical protein
MVIYNSQSDDFNNNIDDDDDVYFFEGGRTATLSISPVLLQIILYFLCVFGFVYPRHRKETIWASIFYYIHCIYICKTVTDTVVSCEKRQRACYL